ncbi:unnamed protein product [Peniophora sp. CBMAI 1063]|nr:unnamed protein product [Peniophora sp. CBMAI 1063]
MLPGLDPAAATSHDATDSTSTIDVSDHQQTGLTREWRSCGLTALAVAFIDAEALWFAPHIVSSSYASHSLLLSATSAIAGVVLASGLLLYHTRRELGYKVAALNDQTNMNTSSQALLLNLPSYLTLVSLVGLASAVAITAWFAAPRVFFGVSAVTLGLAGVRYIVGIGTAVARLAHDLRARSRAMLCMDSAVLLG